MDKILEEIILPKLSVQIPRPCLESKFKKKAYTEKNTTFSFLQTLLPKYWICYVLVQHRFIRSEEMLGMFTNTKLGFVLFIAWFREVFITNSVHYQGR